MMNLTNLSARKKLLAFVLLAGSAGSASHAMAQAPGMKFEVPFAFGCGTQIFPAGTYRISFQTGHTIVVRGAQSKQFAYVMTNYERRLDPQSRGKVIFRSHDGKYFLSEAWEAGNPVGRKTVRGRVEKEVELADAAAGPKAELAINAVP